MSRKLLCALLSLVLCAGVSAAQEKRQVIGGSDKKATPPSGIIIRTDQAQGAWRVLQAPQDQVSNAELLALLKKAVQILEAQSAQRQPRPGEQAHKAQDELQKRLHELQDQLRKQEVRPEVRLDRVRMKPASPELEKAMAEVKAAELRLQEAKARLAKLQGALPEPGKRVEWQVVPRQPLGTPPPKAGDLEQRINRLIQEVEEIRKELKKGRQ